MAEVVKGINIVLGADTTALSAALSDVNKRSKDIQSELRQVDKLLKLDPTNTELLTQKQKLLGDALDNTGEKLNRLRDAQKQVDEQFRKGEISEGQYRAFQREVAKTEQELRSLQSGLDKTGDSLKRAGRDADAASEKFKKIGDGIKNAGEKMTVGITAPLAGIAAFATKGTEEFRKFTARLEVNAQAAGASMEDMSASLRSAYAVTGELDSGVEALSNLLAAGFKGDAFREALDSLTGAAIKFSDTLKLEGVADGLQETLATGAAIGPFAELLERSGVSLDVFNAGLTEAIQNGQQQQYVLEQLADLGLAKVNEAYRENNKEMVENAEAQYSLQEAMSELGTLLTPIITAVTEKLAELVGWFNSLDDGTKKTILTLGGIAAAIGPILVVVGQLASGLGVVTKVFGVVSTAMTAAGGASSAFGGVVAALTGPIGIAVAAIAGLIAIFVTLYKKNEEFREGVKRIWDQIKEGFTIALNAIMDTVRRVFNAIVEFVQEQLEEVRKFWDENGEAIMEIVKMAFASIKNVIDLNMAWIKALFQAVWPIITSVVKVAWEAIKLAISTALDVISGVLTIALKLFQGDWKGAWEALLEMLKNVWDNIIQFLKNIDLVQIGKDIMGGLLDGMKSMFGAIKDSVSNVSSSVVNGFKNALGIHSPSRVMRELGENTGEGFVLGLKDTVGYIKQQASSMAAAVTQGASGATIGVSGSPASPAAATLNFAGMFAGANFIVRSDSDIAALAQQLGAVIDQRSRAGGYSG